jgi:hypothetical protein
MTRRKIGNWKELDYEDEPVEHRGLTWYKVVGGFGGRGDRDDWVADVQGACVSVTKWSNEKWSNRFDALEEAMDDEVVQKAEAQRSKVQETALRLAEEASGLAALDAAAALMN